MSDVRAATRDRHVRLERRIDPKTTFSSLDRYRAFLVGLYGFHVAFQGRLERCTLDHVPVLAPLPDRSGLIATDLEYLGVDPARLPRCQALPATPTAARTMGALYVIEGSALGGAVLARVAKRALGLTSLTGAGFFAADADLSRRWKLVVTSLEHQATIDGSEPIIAGAVDTFDCMEGWLWP